MKIPLKYKDRREEGDTVLRQCQLVQLHLLYVLDAICKKHNIQYSLDSGTLLGAIRHNGFIPWDDDLDVLMSIKDYKKFLKIAKQELPEDVILQTPETTPERVFAFAKLRDAYSFYAEASRGVSMMHPNGIFIDVFTYEKIPNLGFMERPLVILCKKMWHWGRAFRCSGGRGWFYAIFGGWCALVCYALHFAIYILLKAMGLFIPCKRIYYNLRTVFYKSYPKDALYPLSEHVFEDGVFPVPKDPEAFLSSGYGDWRTLPPEESRIDVHGKLVLPMRAIRISSSKIWQS